MSKFLLLLLILVAVLATACGDDDSESTAIETSPAVSTSPTKAPSATGGDDTSDGVHASSQLPISVIVTTGEGWEVPEDADLPDIFAVVQTEFPLGYLDFVQPTEVYNYPSISESVVGDPPADYVQWLNDNPFDIVTASKDVTVGGLQGTRLTIANPDNESFSLFKLSEGDYHLSYQDTDYVYVLDADGTQVLVICGTDNGRDFAEFQTTCEEAVATAEFGS